MIIQNANQPQLPKVKPGQGPAQPPKAEEQQPQDGVQLTPRNEPPAPLKPPAHTEEPSKLGKILGNTAVLASAAAGGVAAGAVGMMGGAIGATAGAVAGAVLGLTAVVGLGAAAFVAIAKESPILAIALIIAAPVTAAIAAPFLWGGAVAGMAAVGALGAAGGPVAAGVVGLGGAVVGASIGSAVKASFGKD